MKEFKAIRPNGEKYRGVRYREHPTRKHGLHPDRYYLIRYWAKGKTQNEGIGWASEGIKPSDAYQRLIDIKAALKVGTYETPAEKKARNEAEREAKERIEAEQKTAAMTFSEVWKKYFPSAKENKHPQSWKREDALYRLYLSPVIGEKPMAEVAAFDLERLKRNMSKAGLSPRSIHYALAVVRQVYRYAKRNDLYSGDVPTEKVTKPKFDNRRMRYLTHEETDTLLAELKKRSRDLHDMALLSLQTGMRAGEIFNLTWACVDLDRKQLTLLDTKNSRSRRVFLNDKAVEVFEGRKPDKSSELVFMSRTGGKVKEISNAFSRAVRDLGFNDGITDRRSQVTFHTLRHTHASWLVDSGVDLYTVKELLGHRDFAMTSRYAHVGNSTLRAAVERLDKALAEKAEVVQLHD